MYPLSGVIKMFNHCNIFQDSAIWYCVTANFERTHIVVIRRVGGNAINIRNKETVAGKIFKYQNLKPKGNTLLDFVNEYRIVEFNTPESVI